MSEASVHGLAGIGGGVIALLLTYPLLAVNTRQQTERRLRVQGRLLSVSRFSGTTVAQLLESASERGLSGLYQGLKASLVGTAASQGIYYYVYELQKGWLAAQRHQQGHGDGAPVGTGTTLLIATLAGMVNVVITNPIWVMVTRMQTETQVRKARLAALEAEAGQPLSEEAVEQSLGKPVTVLGAVSDMYQEAGILGFWKGVLPGLVMVSNPAIQFMIYESLLQRLKVRRLRSKGRDNGVSAGEVFLVGALAKLGATLATYPLLVVKSRLQAKQDLGSDSRQKYIGTADAIFKMLRYEGLLSFYKGMGTKIVQSVFAAAVLFMTKEELVKLARAVVASSRAAALKKQAAKVS